MSCEVFTAPRPLPSAPIVVTCTAPVAAPIPIPIPSQAVPMSVSVVSLPVTSTTLPVRPAFNWRNTTDRLREGLHRPLPFERPNVRRHHQSVFLEMGLIKEEENDKDDIGINDNDDELCEREDMDEILPRARQARPVSGIFLTNFLRLGFEDVDNPATPTGSPSSLGKRLSWSPAGTPSSSTDMSSLDGTLSPVSTNTFSTRSRTWSMATSVTTQSSGLSDRKRPWFAKLRGDSSSSKGSARLVRNRSLRPLDEFTK
ncbi:hypothetical protein SBRCBS47491_003987 [Sporothrix bragantina]|uniref:Uncharacterized protein n=1 Tax=Sporothrix bragantina TaxID=671064 RepID=A0ABP0BK12_9PEZI